MCTRMSSLRVIKVDYIALAKIISYSNKEPVHIIIGIKSSLNDNKLIYLLNKY